MQPIKIHQNHFSQKETLKSNKTNLLGSGLAKIKITSIEAFSKIIQGFAKAPEWYSKVSYKFEEIQKTTKTALSNIYSGRIYLSLCMVVKKTISQNNVLQHPITVFNLSLANPESSLT